MYTTFIYYIYIYIYMPVIEYIYVNVLHYKLSIMWLCDSRKKRLQYRARPPGAECWTVSAERMWGVNGSNEKKYKQNP